MQEDIYCQAVEMYIQIYHATTKYIQSCGKGHGVGPKTNVTVWALLLCGRPQVRILIRQEWERNHFAWGRQYNCCNLGQSWYAIVLGSTWVGCGNHQTPLNIILWLDTQVCLKHVFGAVTMHQWELSWWPTHLHFAKRNVGLGAKVTLVRGW